MTQNLSAQLSAQAQKVWYFDEKKLHWASVVRGYNGRTQGKQLSIVEQMFSSMVILKFALKKNAGFGKPTEFFFSRPH